MVNIPDFQSGDMMGSIPSHSTKPCGKCNESKPLDSFGKRGLAYQAYCKPCNKAYQQEHYKTNRQSYRDRNNRLAKENAEFVRHYKESKPCIDCGVSYPYYVMDFDHLNDKVENISRMMKYPRSAILKEIEKCDLVCANCHRVRTFLRSTS